MTDRPILFSAPMIRALLDGDKTQTRRIIKGVRRDNCMVLKAATKTKMGISTHVMDAAGTKLLRYACGDRLWVREHWRAHYNIDDVPPRDMVKNEAVKFIADGAIDRGFPYFEEGRHRQGMHLPRCFSRLTLTVTNVRVQRLQDISHSDAMAEGCPLPNMVAGPYPRDWYAELWDQINGPGAWDVNPWVAAYSFTVQRGNIDQ